MVPTRTGIVNVVLPLGLVIVHVTLNVRWVVNACVGVRLVDVEPSSKLQENECVPQEKLYPDPEGAAVKLKDSFGAQGTPAEAEEQPPPR